MADNLIVDGNIVSLKVGRDWFYYDASRPALGAGAMGTVYLGRHVHDSHYRVAIKLVNPEYARLASVRARARQEADLAFRHRNLVEMIGLCEGQTPDAPMFIVSKLVQGTTLDQHVRQFDRRPDRTRRIVTTLLPVLDALEFIHDKGIIHLDIKPSNIMVENGCNVRLMDLGISFTESQPGISASGLLGTPGYAAPEQYFDGVNGTRVFGPTTDIYQFGATLYELLSGKKPYGNNPERLDKIDGIGTALMKVVSKSLARVQTERYQTVGELRKQLVYAMNKKDNILRRISGSVLKMIKHSS